MLATILLSLSLAQAQTVPEQYQYIPDPGVGFALSVAVGGGSGHYYAKRGDLGTLFLGGEVFASAILIQSFERDFDKPEWIVGISTLALFRVAEIVTIIPVTNQTRRKMIDARLNTIP